MANILIVEDEAIVAMENKINLNKAGHHILAIVSSAEAAINSFNENTPDIIIMDIKLRGLKDGIDVMNELRAYSNVPVVFLTGNSDPKTKIRIEEISNASYLLKPTLTKEIVNEVNRMLSVD